MSSVQFYQYISKDWDPKKPKVLSVEYGIFCAQIARLIMQWPKRYVHLAIFWPSSTVFSLHLLINEHLTIQWVVLAGSSSKEGKEEMLIHEIIWGKVWNSAYLNSCFSVVDENFSLLHSESFKSFNCDELALWTTNGLCLCSQGTQMQTLRAETLFSSLSREKNSFYVGTRLLFPEKNI